MRRYILITGLMLSFGIQAQVTVTQTTHGHCSPAVANVSGNVTITCKGVDPRALNKLNKILALEKRLIDNIEKAEAWANRYHDLSNRLSNKTDNQEIEQKAAQLVKIGNFDEAGKLLDGLLEKETQAVQRLATQHYNRAEVYTLQFLPLKALPHYAKAVQYAPNNQTYVLAYADGLFKQAQLKKANGLYENVFRTTQNPKNLTIRVNNVKALKGLAQTAWFITEDKTKKLKLDEQLVKSYRELNTVTNNAYQYDLALALITYGQTLIVLNYKEIKKAETIFRESSTIFLELAKLYPEKKDFYTFHAAGALLNLGLFLKIYDHTKQQAQKVFKEIIAIFDQGDGINYDYLSVDQAAGFIVLAFLYKIEFRHKDVVMLLDKTIPMLESNAAINTEHYRAIPILYHMKAHALMSLYQNERAAIEVEKGIVIATELAKRSPGENQPILAELFQLSSVIHRKLSKHELSLKREKQALELKKNYNMR